MDFFKKHKCYSIKNKGFSLTELVIVMAIMAILILIAVPSVSKFISQADNQSVDTAAATIHTVTRAKLRDLDGRTDIPTSIYAVDSNLYNVIFSGSNLSHLDSKLFIDSYNYKNLPTITDVESKISATPNYTTWVMYLPNHTLSDPAPTDTINLDLSYPILIFCIIDGEPTRVYNNGLNVTATYRRS